MRWDQWPTDAPTHWPDPALAGLEFFLPDHHKQKMMHGQATEEYIPHEYAWHAPRGKRMLSSILHVNDDPNERSYIGTADLVRSEGLSLGRTPNQWCFICREEHGYHEAASLEQYRGQSARVRQQGRKTTLR